MELWSLEFRILSNMNPNRNYIDQEGVKVIAISGNNHCEIDFDHNKMSEYKNNGWFVYAINKEGIFFYLNNCQDDGKDWCKISKR